MVSIYQRGILYQKRIQDITMYEPPWPRIFNLYDQQLFMSFYFEKKIGPWYSLSYIQLDFMHAWTLIERYD